MYNATNVFAHLAFSISELLNDMLQDTKKQQILTSAKYWKTEETVITGKALIHSSNNLILSPY